MAVSESAHRRLPAVLLAAALVASTAPSLLLGCGETQQTPDGAGGQTTGLRTTPYIPSERTYYIAADDVVWDYAPTDTNVHKDGRAWNDDEAVFMVNGPHRIGREYKKTLYRAYTDGTFTELAQRDPKWDHTGNLGPILRGVVGDTIRIVFRNNSTRPYSMHPHGVFYDKDSEGAPYADGTSGSNKADDAVPPGGEHTYIWGVPDTAGPGPADGSSVVWLYHSHTMSVPDVNSGLVGAIIVTSAPMAADDGTPLDIDREFVTLFTVANENVSHHLEDNIANYTQATGDVAAALLEDGDFEESNLMHMVNGFLWSNGPMMTMTQGERVRWYLLSVGTEVDLHTPHWHGNTALHDGHRTDVVELMPASMKVADMRADNVGTWAYHCHVDDHMAAGMMARYQVLPAP